MKLLEPRLQECYGSYKYAKFEPFYDKLIEITEQKSTVNWLQIPNWGCIQQKKKNIEKIGGDTSFRGDMYVFLFF